MQFALQTGLTLRAGQRTLELTRELPDQEYQFEDVITRRAVILGVAELIHRIYSKEYQVVLGGAPEGRFANRTVVSVLDLSALKEHERTELERRLDYVSRLRRQGITKGQRKRIEEAIAKLANSRGEAVPSATTVMLWMRNYEISGNNALALVNKHRMRKRARRLIDSVEDVIWRMLKQHYLTPHRNSLRFTYDQLESELKRLVKSGQLEQDTAQMSFPTLARRVQDIDLYTRVAAREGVARARMVCRTAFPEGVAAYPYQRVEIDHTPLNWVVICDRTGLPLGRPVLTVMIDAYSGYILGFYISFYGPGLTSVCGVVRNALLPKAPLLHGLDLQSDWLSMGLGDEWVIDNGLEFHSFGFKTMAMALGVDLMYCRVRTPWLKPHVERFFSTLNTLTLMKGRIRPSVANVARIDPYKDASITFSDLVRGLLMFVVDVYPHQPNWRKMAMPYELFAEGIQRCPPATFPGSLEQLTWASGMSKQLTLHQGGIGFHGLPYGSYAFKDIVKKYGPKQRLLCKFDPDDISIMKVLDPDGLSWHDAVCRWPAYARGLSFNQHQLIRKFAKADLSSPERYESLLASRQRLHEHWMEATNHRGRADALRAGRYADMTSHKVLSSSDSSPQLPLSESKQLIVPSEYRISEKEIPEFESLAF
ncbi:DDE-type integrase/transposase/recombinase [Comamonas aquatilis]|uniref:transposase n=1 Tax=Comamonas aquatilis TaxID=1778406 RepID=UPI0039F10B8F